MNIELGNLIKDAQQRDAIHIALAPVIAGEKLYPGQHVGLKPGESWVVLLASDSIEPIGIIDPFLIGGAVYPDQHCWLLLYPNTITSLRHEWTHPAFKTRFPEPIPLTVDQEEARKYIESLADDVGVDYERLIQGANEFLDDGNYLVGGSSMQGASTPDTFWTHFETMTDRRVPQGNRKNFFSCSC